MKRLAKALVVARIKENAKQKSHTWGKQKAGPWDRPHKADGGSIVWDEPAAPDPASIKWDDAPVRGPLSNASDDGYLSSGAKSVGTAAIKGLSNSAGTVGNLGNFSDYLLARAHSAITGRPVEDVLADYASKRQAHAKDSTLGSVAEGIDPSKIMPSGEDISAPILKRTGEYKPESELGKMGQSGLETAFGMIGPGGGAAAEGKGAAAVLGAAARMAPGAFASGAVGQGVTDATGDPLLGMAAGMVTPAAGSAAASKIGSAAAKVARPFAEDLPVVGGRYAGQRDQMVRERLLSEAQDPAAFEHALFPGPRRPGGDEIIPGSSPTTGQLTGDMGVLGAERRAVTDDNTPFNIRATEQDAARRAEMAKAAPDADTMKPSQFFQQQLDHVERGANEAVDRIRSGAQSLAGQLGPGETPENLGASIRNPIRAVYDTAKKARSALYDAVDPDGSVSLVATPVRERSQELLKGLDPYDSPLKPDEARIFGRVKSLPDVMPFKSLIALDKDIYAAMSAERRSAGETPTWGRLTQLKNAVGSAINNAVDNQAAHEQAAVAAGKLKPEDTIRGRMEALHGDYGGHLGIAPGNAGTAAGENAGLGAAGLFGAHGAPGEGNRGSGNVARAARVPAEVAAPQDVNAPPSLLQFIASKGGLGPDPELEAIGAHSHTVNVDNVGRRKLVRQGGWPLDYAREAAEEAGYLRGDHNGTSGVNDLLDAIDAEMRGQKRYPEGYEGSVGKREFAAMSERERAEYDRHVQGLEDDLNDAGHGDLGPDVKQRAVKLMSSEGMDADTAVEHALHQLEQEDAGVQHSFPGDRAASQSPGLQPNFDSAAAARLTAAKASHQALAETFRNPTIKPVLRTLGGSENYQLPTGAIPSRAVVKGDKGYQAATAFLKAAKNSPEVVTAMQDRALSPLRTSLKSDGTINSAKFDAWKRDYAGTLKAIDEVQPGFSKRFDNASRASDLLVEAGARRDEILKGAQKSIAADFLKLSTPVEVENKIGTILQSKTGPSQMRELIQRAGNDPQVVAGLRKAGADWMTRKFAATTESGTSGEKKIQKGMFDRFVRDNATTLGALYPAEQVNMFRAIAKDMDRTSRVLATNVLGSPGTAKDVGPILNKLSKAAGEHKTLTGAVVGALGAALYHTGSLTTALAAAGIAVPAYLIKTMRAAGIEKAEDMFRDALLNPERARYYLAKIPAGAKADTSPLFSLSRSIRRGLVMAPILKQ